jgi:hypothetical protein
MWRHNQEFLPSLRNLLLTRTADDLVVAFFDPSSRFLASKEMRHPTNILGGHGGK